MDNDTLCTHFVTLMMILVDKNIVTPEELKRYQARATAWVDQTITAEKELYLKEQEK